MATLLLRDEVAVTVDSVADEVAAPANGDTAAAAAAVPVTAPVVTKEDEDKGDSGAVSTVVATEAPKSVIPAGKSPSQVVPVAERLPQQAHYRYIIVGGGVSAYAALSAIREDDQTGDVLLVSSDEFLPYVRPACGDDLWKSKDDKIAQTLTYTDWLGEDIHCCYATVPYPNDVHVPVVDACETILGVTATGLDVQAHTVTLENGATATYGKILLCTGASPRALPLDVPAVVADKLSTYRGLKDFQQLELLLREPEVKHVAIIGGGFLGSELAYHLARRGTFHDDSAVTVTHIMTRHVLSHVVPEYISHVFGAGLQDAGVILKRDTQPTAVLVAPSTEGAQQRLRLQLASGESVDVDHAVVCVGVVPNTGIAEAAGLEIDERNGGIVVNGELEARRDVYACGDAASYYDEALGRRRIEHYDHASSTGTHAGRNMSAPFTGKPIKPFTHQSMMWCHVGEPGFEAVGIVDSRLSTVGFWKPGKDVEEKVVDGSAAAATATVTEATAAGVVSESAPNNSIDQHMLQTYGPDWRKRFDKGIIYYLREGRVVGVLTFNVYAKFDAAAEIIRSKKTFSKASELESLINID